MKTLKDLIEERDAKTKAARNILENNSGALSAEKQAELDALYAGIEDIDQQIANLRRQLDIEANDMSYPERANSASNALHDMAQNNPDSPSQQAGGSAPLSPEDEVRNIVFNAFLRGGDRAVARLPENVLSDYERMRAELSTGTEADGGALVPTTFAGELLMTMQGFGGMRSVATVRRMASGETIQWPTVDDTTEEGEWIAENTGVDEDGDPNFGVTTIGAHLMSSKAVAVPFALMQDAMIGDVGAMLNPMLAMRLGRGSNRAYTTGDGVGKPTGIVGSAAMGHETSAGMTDTFTDGDFIELEHSIDIAYRSESSFMMGDTALKMIKKMKDADGRPLWVPGVTASAPAEIWGYSYTVNTHMPDPAAGAKSVLFGKMKNYLIRDVMDVRLFRFTDSAYTKKGQVGFLAMMRTDGKNIAADDKSIKALQHAAA